MLDTNPQTLSISLQQIRVGKIRRLAATDAVSAINKQPVEHAVYVGKLGLAGDQQADLKHHGGLDKAVHHYPADHYLFWQQQLNKNIDVGMFGENFSSHGLTEQNVHIGDIFKVGECLLQVSQARQPCWKLNEHFQIEDMAMHVQNSLRTGWYYRVLQQGEVTVGDKMRLLERIEPNWPLIRLLRIVFEHTLDYSSLQKMTELDSLAENWKKLAENRLKYQQVESWQYRLTRKRHGHL